METSSGLQRKIHTAGDLQSVVSTMKALAASGISESERAVLALDDYYRTVELGLATCFRKSESLLAPDSTEAKDKGGEIGVVIFGSDQGLVGKFNETVTDFAIQTLPELSGKALIWAVGERVQLHLEDLGLDLAGRFPMPNSVPGIATLVARIQIESEARRKGTDTSRLFLVHNRPQAGSVYTPVCQRLLPLDAEWQRGLAKIPWPSPRRPEVLLDGTQTLGALIHEYLFISLFRACAESLASENASRLAAMQRAEKNIDDLLEQLRGESNRLRQSSIDEELFDVISGYEALAGD